MVKMNMRHKRESRLKKEYASIFKELSTNLDKFHREIYSLTIMGNTAMFDCFLLQLIDSIRRIEYFNALRENRPTEKSTDARVVGFNPIRAALYFSNSGQIDEAFWLVFLSTHYGKNLKTGWGSLRAFYSGLGSSSNYWNWDHIKGNFDQFTEWYKEYDESIRLAGAFGNHRKYQSHRFGARNGTYLIVKSLNV